MLTRTYKLAKKNSWESFDLGMQTHIYSGSGDIMQLATANANLYLPHIRFDRLS